MYCKTSRGEAGADLLIGLPGSHSKWVEVADGCIVHFDTFMTGEVFAVLSEHSILGRTQQRGASFDGAAFDRGVQVALSADGEIGPLSTLFSARSLGLTGELSATAQADYLSGLMIGHELSALATRAAASAQQRASAFDHPYRQFPTLCSRYSRALDACGFARVTLAEQATERGLWQLALAAGLISPLHIPLNLTGGPDMLKQALAQNGLIAILRGPAPARSRRYRRSPVCRRISRHRSAAQFP